MLQINKKTVIIAIVLIAILYIISDYKINLGKKGNIIEIDLNGTKVSQRIDINNETDIINKRSEIINALWGNSIFPYEKLPTQIERNISDTLLSSLPNLKSIDKITVAMDYGINSTIYHLHPINNKNKLVIYHEGHRYDLNKRTIKFFLARGYSVIALSMPLITRNKPTEVKIENKIVNLTDHNNFTLLDSDNFSSLKFFIEPLAASINYVEKEFNYSGLYMVGISGGGLATTLYSAIDTRIQKSYPIASSQPLSIYNGDHIDYEEKLPKVYNISNFMELYIMGAYGDGRKQLQILNVYDPCCFSGRGYLTYKDIIKEKVKSLGKGEFDVYGDETNNDHIITDMALSIIIRDIENQEYQADKNRIIEELQKLGFKTRDIKFGKVQPGDNYALGVILESNQDSIETTSKETILDLQKILINNSVANLYIIGVISKTDAIILNLDSKMIMDAILKINKNETYYTDLVQPILTKDKNLKLYITET